ncbi:MAG: hypothetical protein V1899_12335 [Planctomycetota bacterium]
MRVLLGSSRILAIGLVFAVAGFCYGVSNSMVESRMAEAGARAVGTGISLRFTNPLVLTTTEYDLGDACLGGMLTRYVTAEGGLRPYRFTSIGSNSLTNAIAGTYSTLALGLSGAMAGSAPFSLSPSHPLHRTVLGTPGLRFEVTVADSQGTSVATRTAFFNLFLFDRNTTSFRFAVDKLPDARLTSAYIGQLEVLGGTAPYTFTLESVTGVARLEDLGLFLTSDGLVMGTPLQEGSFVLTVRCADSTGKIAAGRNGSGQNQAFTLLVQANPVTSSDLITTFCSVRGDNVRAQQDILKYSGVINTLGQDNFALLDSDVSFRLANLKIAGKLNRAGKFTGQMADGSKVQMKVRVQSGKIDVIVRKGMFGLALNTAALVDGAITRKPLAVAIGAAVASCETLDFETSVRGSKFGLNYKLGRDGTSAAGRFQIISVRGKDGENSGGLPGDAWKVGFLAAARSGITTTGLTQGLNNVTSATIYIGTKFQQTLAGDAFKSRGQRTIFSGSGDGVKKFLFNANNGKGQLQTNVISLNSTGIPQAARASAYSNLFFPLGVNLTRTTYGAPFSGEHARRIFGFRTQYKDTPPQR